jgi:multiple sugar transport system substrate-binding protein
MRRVLGHALAVGALLAMTAAGQAQQKVIWWDFLGGGDGIRMKKLITDFNAEHAGKIEIEATTLDWGVPFYTKVQTSAAVGEGPDVMTITRRASRWRSRKTRSPRSAPKI